MRLSLNGVCREAEEVHAEVVGQGTESNLSPSSLMIAVMEFCYEVETEKWIDLMQDGKRSVKQWNKVFIHV
jgi:hypothetical protein